MPIIAGRFSTRVAAIPIPTYSPDACVRDIHSSSSVSAYRCRDSQHPPSTDEKTLGASKASFRAEKGTPSFLGAKQSLSVVDFALHNEQSILAIRHELNTTLEVGTQIPQADDPEMENAPRLAHPYCFGCQFEDSSSFANLSDWHLGAH